ncbi:MAG: hypothetical protein ABI165_02635 [Bryobacteraceae bacterium]
MTLQSASQPLESFTKLEGDKPEGAQLAGDQLAGEIFRAKSALLHSTCTGLAHADEQLELLDAIAQDLRRSHARRLRQLPSLPEETEAPLALLRHLARSVQHLQNLS